MLQVLHELWESLGASVSYRHISSSICSKWYLLSFHAPAKLGNGKHSFCDPRVFNSVIWWCSTHDRGLIVCSIGLLTGYKFNVLICYKIWYIAPLECCITSNCSPWVKWNPNSYWCLNILSWVLVLAAAN